MMVNPSLMFYLPKDHVELYTENILFLFITRVGVALFDGDYFRLSIGRYYLWYAFIPPKLWDVIVSEVYIALDVHAIFLAI